MKKKNRMAVIYGPMDMKVIDSEIDDPKPGQVQIDDQGGADLRH